MNKEEMMRDTLRSVLVAMIPVKNERDMSGAATAAADAIKQAFSALDSEAVQQERIIAINNKIDCLAGNIAVLDTRLSQIATANATKS